jgi:hypothetical protein
MDDLKRNRQRRIRQHHEGLRTTEPACPFCGRKDPRGLELHHIFGRRYGNETRLICKYCHAILTDEQIDHPDPVFDPPDEFECIIHALANTADMFELMAPAFREHIQWMIDWHQKSVTSDEELGESENHKPNPGDKKS